MLQKIGIFLIPQISLFQSSWNFGPDTKNRMFKLSKERSIDQVADYFTQSLFRILHKKRMPSFDLITSTVRSLEYRKTTKGWVGRVA